MLSEKDGWRNETFRINALELSLESCEDTSKLDLEKRISLAKELTPLTGKGFLRFDITSQELAEDVFNHVVYAPRLMIVRNRENLPVAFLASSTKKIDEQMVYDLEGIIVDPTLHGSGLGLKLLKEELLRTKADILILRTQSKKMFGLASKVAILDAELTLHFAKTFYPTNLDGFINRGVYRGGHSLYEDETAFAKDAIEEIDWRAGDSLVVCGWVI